MTIQLPQTWEYRLLSWAQEGLRSPVPSGIAADHTMLESAYRHCDTITQIHSRTFYMASGLLSPEKRKATRALYAFCRVTDDIVDSPGDQYTRYARLREWKQHVMATHPPAYDLVALAWADTRARYNIPSGYAEQLIDGVALDLEKSRYDTFDELAAYAYGVASTVGLMAMHIIGFDGETALPYAVKLGVALQLTNILRDVQEDSLAGRLYLPQDELKAYGLTEDDIQSRCIDDRWRAFMQFQIDRNHQLYEESRPGLALLDPDGSYAIAAAADLYEAILDDIQKHDYDVFSRRAHLGTVAKVTRLPGIWWRNRQLHSRERS